MGVKGDFGRKSPFSPFSRLTCPIDMKHCRYGNQIFTRLCIDNRHSFVIFSEFLLRYYLKGNFLTSKFWVMIFSYYMRNKKFGQLHWLFSLCLFDAKFNSLQSSTIELSAQEYPIFIIWRLDWWRPLLKNRHFQLFHKNVRMCNIWCHEHLK